MRAGALAAGVACAAASVLAFSGSAEATFPGKNGRIVFFGSQSPMFVGPTGGVPSDLVVGPANKRRGLGGERARFAPGGRRLAYPCWIGVKLRSAICVENIDGSGRRPITASVGDHDLAWTPDGAHIAFVRGSRTLYEVGANGQNLHRLPVPTECGSGVASLDVSRSGMLAYTCIPPRDYVGPPHGVMIASSLDSPPVDSGCDVEQPRFSPDGTRILVLRLGSIDTISPEERAASQNGIVRTCNTLVGLETEMPVAAATWSPDGTKIAFIGGYAPLGLLSADGKTVLWKFNGRGKYGHVEVSTSTLDWACTGACR